MGQVISFIFSLFSGYKDERPPDSEDKGGVRPDSGDKNAQQSSIPVEDKQIVIDIPNVSDENTQQQKTEETVIPTPPAAPATEDGHITIQVEDGVPADDSSLVQVSDETTQQQKTEETVIPTPPAAPATEDGHITIQVEDGVPADDSSLVQVSDETTQQQKTEETVIPTPPAAPATEDGHITIQVEDGVPADDSSLVQVSDETTQQQKTEETVIPTPPAAPATEDGHITIQVEDGVPADDSSLVQVIKERSKDPRVKGKFRIQVNDESVQIIPKPIKWIKHYCNTHKILIVGDGDFSFSACLAKAFGSAQNMVATSLDSIGFLRKNYGMSTFNIAHLKNGGGVVIHEFDATKMSSHQSVKGIKFDRIIYNFPLAGFFKDESRKYQLNLNKMLVKLFCKNASKMIADDGEIHISHKCNGFFRDWNLVKLAQEEGLLLLESVVFNLCDYPGYNTKYGFGGDNNFDCNPSRTYKFRLEQKAL